MDEVRLAEFLSEKSGKPVQVVDWRRVASSYSRVNYAVVTTVGRFIVRIQQGDAPVSSASDEFQLMQSLAAASFPVPKPRWSEPTGNVLGRPFVIMEHLDARPVDEQAVDQAAATAFVATLARLHRVDAASQLPAVDPAQATHIQIERWRAVGKSVGGPRVPVLDAVEIWLHQNAPLDNKVALVHGAPRPGNILMADGEFIALTDWETAHIGNPAEDWSYNLATRVPVASRQLWLNLFEREASFRLSTAQWTYWDAFNMYKAACINRVCLALFESGADYTPAQAIAGTAEYHGFLRRLMKVIE
ncbi:MAG: phosphotransferase family protein [Ilumatobacteraceae bacterium]